VCSGAQFRIADTDDQMVELIGRGGEIRTHGPLRPRPFRASSERCLFSTASVSSGWRAAVETRGFTLKPEESASYKIIYSAVDSDRFCFVAQSEFARWRVSNSVAWNTRQGATQTRPKPFRFPP
jgi:hypothetical protein